MKTAEEWLADKQWCERQTPNTGNFTVYGIEAIQRDAILRAISEAEDCHGEFDGYPWDSGAGSSGYDKACNDIAARLKRIIEMDFASNSAVIQHPSDAK